jgi:hypothetical protein
LRWLQHKTQTGRRLQFEHAGDLSPSAGCIGRTLSVRLAGLDARNVSSVPSIQLPTDARRRADDTPADGAVAGITRQHELGRNGITVQRRAQFIG